jgi:hypothetical protein
VYMSFNYVTELKKLARGKQTIISPQDIANALLPTVEVGMRELTKRDDVSELERLFALEDPRG